MTETNVLPFPGRVDRDSPDRNDVLLAKIKVALRAMQDLHAELESLKAMLKSQNGADSPA